MPQPVFRLAPSPNGFLHLGHAYSALLNQKMARDMGGRLLLRMEDTDQTRCTPAFAEAAMQDLAWLGLSWEEPVRFQSNHLSDYHAALQSLWQREAIYPCFCSRKQAARHALSSTDPDGQPQYGGTCRSLPQEQARQRIERGDIHGWRLRTMNTPAQHWGDVMIAKPTVGSLYHIAVVVDDALQGVTHVVRGKDMEAATPIHQLLQRHLGFSQPHYHHHKLILDETGQKLSKSLKSTGIRALREDGMTAEEVKRRLGF